MSAARLLGERPPVHHVRRDPAERVPPILVEFTVRLGYAIFTVATLSFLGFGIQPPTPDWGADIAANYALVGRLLVGVAVPGARHRLAGDRGQPDRRRDRAGARAMSATTAAPPRRRTRRCATWTSPTGCAARPAGAAQRLVPRSAAASRTGWSASPGAASPRSRWRRALPAAQRPGQRRARSASTAQDPLADADERAARAAGHDVSMVYQEPGARAEPVAPGRPPDRRGVRGRAASARARPRERRRGDAAQGPDLRSRPGHGPLPAPAVRRHGAAGGDRDGAGRRARAADPRRADHRAGRDRRGRGARPGRRAARGVRHRRCCSSATTSA